MPANNIAAAALAKPASRAQSERPSLAHYLTLAFQLGLFLILVYQFNLESRAFLHLGILTFFGWSVHYFLPLRYRLFFFVLLSLAGIELVFGFQEEDWSAYGLAQGAWIIVVGLGLIGICHLPVSFALRVALLAVVGGTLAAARAGMLAVPWSGAIWPVLASMFMFRLIVYLYQLRHDKKPAGVLETLSYFFMLPNVCFPLYPVVDFQTFRRTYYDDTDRHRIYQTGIHWLFRGAIHLILYRLVYHNFVLEAGDVVDGASLLQYLIWPFLLYLRVSGTFHIIAGLLHLFGFNLSETQNLYFLSSSFTDFWRRVNIYWKDFIMKVFYYPVYFKVRKWSDTSALIVATLFAFFMTWLLHAYQWFWLRGTWLLAWNDGLFWAILALLVVANALYESKHGRRRRLSGGTLSWRETLPTALRTIGVFSTIAVLWSFWYANSVDEWLSVWGALGRPSAFDYASLLILVATLFAIGVPAALLSRGLVDRRFNFAKSAAAVTATGLVLIAMSTPYPQQSLGSVARETLASLKTSELNRRDLARLERGYYENLLNVAGLNFELWEIYRTRPVEWQPLSESEFVRQTGGLPHYELLPSLEYRHRGAVVRTNRWAMRDREYDKVPPPNTLRIAVVGSSFVFGLGVENRETFESVLEERLNREAAGGRHARYEVLNFAVPAYSPLDILAVLENKVFEFEPDYVFYIEHENAARRVLGRTSKILRERGQHPYDFLWEIARKAGIDESNVDEVDHHGLVQELIPYRRDVLSRIYQRIVSACRERGTPVAWIYLPRAEESDQAGPTELELRLAQETGFTILDLSGAYDGHDLSSLWIARWDHHLNALGHKLIGEKLYRVLREASDEIVLGLPASQAAAGQPYEIRERDEHGRD